MSGKKNRSSRHHLSHDANNQPSNNQNNQSYSPSNSQSTVTSPDDLTADSSSRPNQQRPRQPQMIRRAQSPSEPSVNQSSTFAEAPTFSHSARLDYQASNRRASTTSDAVAATLARATASPPSSYHSPAPTSLLSSSLHSRQSKSQPIPTSNHVSNHHSNKQSHHANESKERHVATIHLSENDSLDHSHISVHSYGAESSLPHQAYHLSQAASHEGVTPISISAAESRDESLTPSPTSSAAGAPHIHSRGRSIPKGSNSRKQPPSTDSPNSDWSPLSASAPMDSAMLHVPRHNLADESSTDELEPGTNHRKSSRTSPVVPPMQNGANHADANGKRSKRHKSDSLDASVPNKGFSSINELHVEQAPLQFITNAADSGFDGYTEMAKHESLDYHTIHNELLRVELSALTDSDYVWDNVQRWIVTCFIGALIGLVGFAVHRSIEMISDYKLNLMESYLLQDWRIAFAIFAGFNLGLVLVGSLLIVFFCPPAGGSGIPEVKDFLNGTAISKAMNVKTFVVKLIAAITAVSSTLPVGPEGPMIHMGAMIGGGISQPRSKTLSITLPFFEKFHTDRDRRDFIAMGAACGVASAFGAPLGGVLFAIEEASSFWSQVLTWRTFFACMLATFITNFMLSGVEGKWGSYDFSSVIEFDVTTDATGNVESYAIWELIPFALMGALSGLTGALFNTMSERLAVMRMKYVTPHPGRRILEMIILSVFVSVLYFFSSFYFPCHQCPTSSDPDVNVDCGPGPSEDPTRVNHWLCGPNHYNDMATLTMTTITGAVRHLFSRGNAYEFSLVSLAYFGSMYFLIAVYTSGSAVAGGLLVPLLLIGATYGRFVGHLMLVMGFTVDPGVYALIGAASFFSGVCRMTISLCIIMLEITNDLHYLPAIMLTVMMAKWTGDFLTAPIYEGLMELKLLPFLDPEPPIELDLMVSSDIMATNVKVTTETPLIDDLITLLKSCNHNGFPVVSSKPVHRPIVTEPSNQRVNLGVPVPAHLVRQPSEDSSALRFRPNKKDKKSESARSVYQSRQETQQQESIYQSLRHADMQVNNNSAPASSRSKTKQRQLTAGFDPSLGHGSGRVLRGLILRKQLLILLQSQVWKSRNQSQLHPFTPLEFRQRLALFDLRDQDQLIAEIEGNLTLTDRGSRLDLRPYMNRSPFSVHFDFHSVFCFRLFRSMGLRHLPVVNDANEVVGIITRKDIVHPIVHIKYEALMQCQREGIIEFPGLDTLDGEDSDDLMGDGDEEAPPAGYSIRPTSHGLGRSAAVPVRPALKAYSYLSPLESSPEQPGTPVYGSSPGLLARPLLGHSPHSPSAMSGPHRHGFNWSSRLTTRV